MAKRKRLAPASGNTTRSARAPEVKSFTRFPNAADAAARPPIAHVAADAASSAALDELAREVQDARDTGRLVLRLPLDAIDADYLVRDRMAADEEELTQLADSIREQGQRTPIEVVELAGGRYGLISGWRRLSALKRLNEGEGSQGAFSHVLALLRRPETASDAYRAMVEENELRVGLSFYERARIVAKAAEQGVYADDQAALAGLFASVSRTKRSKIGSFLKLYRALDARLTFPSAITERLGLSVSRALEADEGLGPRLADRLRKAAPDTAEAELALLEKALSDPGEPAPRPAPDKPAPLRKPPARPTMLATVGSVSVTASADNSEIRISGTEFDAEFQRKLVVWLRYNIRG